VVACAHYGDLAVGGPRLRSGARVVEREDDEAGRVRQGGSVSYWQQVDDAGDEGASQLADGEGGGDQTEERRGIARCSRAGLLHADHRGDHECAANQQRCKRDRRRAKVYAGQDDPYGHEEMTDGLDAKPIGVTERPSSWLTPTSPAKATFSTARLACPIRAAASRVANANRANRRSSIHVVAQAHPAKA